MNYLKIYKKIIKYRKKHLLKNKNNEKHHVIPSSLGGSNRKHNIVTLTPKEHYICHLLLTKIVKKDSPAYHSMIYAWSCMSANPAGHIRYKMSKGSLYQKLKRDFRKSRSIFTKGNKNPNYGKIWICNNLTLENKRINKTDTIPNGWKRGRILNRNDYFYITNVKTKITKSHDCNKKIPKGFILGKSLIINSKRVLNSEKFKYSYDNLNEEEKKLVIINKKNKLRGNKQVIKNKLITNKKEKVIANNKEKLDINNLIKNKEIVNKKEENIINNKKIMRNKYNFNEINNYLIESNFDFEKTMNNFNYKYGLKSFKILLNNNIKDYSKIKDKVLKNKYVYLYNIFKECNYNYDIFSKKTNYNNGFRYLNNKFKEYIKNYKEKSKKEQNKDFLINKYTKLFNLFVELNLDYNLFSKTTGYNNGILNLKRLFKTYVDKDTYLSIYKKKENKNKLDNKNNYYLSLYKIYKECNYDYDFFILKSDYKHSKYSKKTLLKQFTKYVPEYLEYKKLLAKTWNIDGHYYNTLAEANKITKISLGAIKKHSVNNVFNRDSYEGSCIIAGVIPKKKIY